MNNDTHKLTIGHKKYVLIGTSLWTGVRKQDRLEINDSMNDYNEIRMPAGNATRKFNVDDMSALHNKALRFVKSAMKKMKPGEIGILMTHHKPYRTDNINDIISQAYETDIIGKVIRQPHRIKVAVYGHTHKSDNSVVDGVRVISNPKGYPHQKTKYINSFTFSV